MKDFAGIIAVALFLLLSSTHCKPTEGNAPQAAPRASPKKNTVCFTHIGCFNKSGTFSPILKMFPESPEQIGTKFTLFSKRNVYVGQDIDYELKDTITTSLFDNTSDTVFLVHGFAIDQDPKDWFLKFAFLNNTNSQVIVVDWRKGARPPAYWTASANTEVVGRQMAVLVKQLVDTRGLNPDKVHIVGSSLGAHAGGFAGKWVRDQYGFLLGRISGNDPAGPYFNDLSDNVHLSPKDAHFVDIIHTNAGRDLSLGHAGIAKSIGHIDFYPNGGVLQPGCQEGHPTCSHMRADDLYAESFNSPDCSFKSYPCQEGYQAFQKGLCRDCGETGCSELGFRAVQKPGRGDQFLTTNGESKFCQPE